MSRNLRLLMCLIASSWSAGVAWGHHSFDAEFDGKKILSLDGVVTKVEWINPHSYIYIDVKDASGNVVNWAVEGFPVGMARRNGISKDFLKPGDAVNITGYASKDGSKRMSGWKITMPDGKKVAFGPMVGGGN